MSSLWDKLTTLLTVARADDINHSPEVKFRHLEACRHNVWRTYCSVSVSTVDTAHINSRACWSRLWVIYDVLLRRSCFVLWMVWTGNSKIQIQHNGIKIGANVCKGRRRQAGRWNVKSVVGQPSDGGCGCVCLRRRRGANGTESVLNVDETEECLNYAPTAVSSARELSSGVSWLVTGYSIIVDWLLALMR